jgi:hypothetical protein
MTTKPKKKEGKNYKKIFENKFPVDWKLLETKPKEGKK